LVLWGRYLSRPEIAGTAFHVVECAIATTAAIFLYRFATRTLNGTGREAPQRRTVNPIPLFAGILVAFALIAISLGAIDGTRSGTLADSYWPEQSGPRSWIKALSFVRYAPFAELTAAELSQKAAGSAKSDSGLSGVKGLQLGGTDLRFADMRAAFLRNSILTDADLRDADLLGADLQQSGVIGADLRGASLANADLRNASLVRTKLEGADTKYAHLEGALGLTPDQIRAADNWCEAFYDPSQLAMLELPSNNNNQVKKWLLFDRDNSSLAAPTTPEAAREADLRRFSILPDPQDRRHPTRPLLAECSHRRRAASIRFVTLPEFITSHRARWYGSNDRAHRAWGRLHGIWSRPVLPDRSKRTVKEGEDQQRAGGWSNKQAGRL
jgi:hypothetical protein